MLIHLRSKYVWLVHDTHGQLSWG